MKRYEQTLRRAALVGLLGALAMSGTACFHADVGPGEVGVVSTPEGISPRPLTEGRWTIGAYDRVVKYSTVTQEREEHIDAETSNGVHLRFDLTVRFRVIAAEAVKLDEEIGPHYYDILVAPTVQSQARRAVGRLPLDAIGTSQRYEIQRQIQEGARHALIGRHVEIESVLIRTTE